MLIREVEEVRRKEGCYYNNSQINLTFRCVVGRLSSLLCVIYGGAQCVYRMGATKTSLAFNRTTTRYKTTKNALNLMVTQK